jgi:hypothetical protein
MYRKVLHKTSFYIEATYTFQNVGINIDTDPRKPPIQMKVKPRILIFLLTTTQGRRGDEKSQPKNLSMFRFRFKVGVYWPHSLYVCNC